MQSPPVETPPCTISPNPLQSSSFRLQELSLPAARASSRNPKLPSRPVPPQLSYHIHTRLRERRAARISISRRGHPPPINAELVCDVLDVVVAYVWGSRIQFLRVCRCTVLFIAVTSMNITTPELREWPGRCSTVCCRRRLRGGFHLRCVALPKKEEEGNSHHIVPPSSFDCRTVVLHPPIFFSSFYFTVKSCSPFGGCSPQGRSSQIASFTERCTRGQSYRNKPS